MLRDALEYSVRVLSGVPFRLFLTLNRAPLKDISSPVDKAERGKWGQQRGQASLKALPHALPEPLPSRRLLPPEPHPYLIPATGPPNGVTVPAPPLSSLRLSSGTPPEFSPSVCFPWPFPRGQGHSRATLVWGVGSIIPDHHIRGERMAPFQLMALERAVTSSLQQEDQLTGRREDSCPDPVIGRGRRTFIAGAVGPEDQ